MNLQRDKHSKAYWIGLRILGFAVSGLLAALVTLTLMIIEENLIHSDRSVLSESKNINLTDIVRIRRDVDVVAKERKKVPPPLPDEMPKIKSNLNFDLAINDAEWSMSNVDTSVNQNISMNTGFSLSDGDYLPLVKVAPAYPRRALMSGLSGWVIVEFTVTQAGNVKSPFVIANCAIPKQGDEAPTCKDRPNSIFDRSAIAAASKFKYKPKVISGEAMATSGVRNKIFFVIES
jgi:protein TonB